MYAFDLDSDKDAYLIDHTGKCTLFNPTGSRIVFLPKPVHSYIMNIEPFIFFERSYLKDLEAKQNHIKAFIISALKSGNHLTRFITEYISSKNIWSLGGDIRYTNS